MPEQDLNLSDAELDLIERVRKAQALPSVEQTVEWLVKTRLRRAASRTAGPRKLQLVAGSKGHR